MTLISLLLASCQNPGDKSTGPNPKTEVQQSTALTDLTYTIAKNYFVKNDVKVLDNPEIETAEKFNTIFGMAPTMENSGEPTKIDFKNQYVIAVVLPETSSETTIKPVSLQKNDKNEIVFTYKVSVGQKQTYTITPCIAIIVDKANDGKVVLNEQK